MNWQDFLDWIEIDFDNRALLLTTGVLRIHISADLLNTQFGAGGARTRRLKKLGIQLDSGHRASDSELFTTECIRTYFNNDANARPQAELLAYARRLSGNGRVAIISQHRGFWRIPMVDTYFIDSSRLQGTKELPAQFDFIQDLHIHRELERAIAPVLDSDQYGIVLALGLTALRDHVRARSGLQTDGRPLMEQAFNESGSFLRLNPLTDRNTGGSQMNEQKGFKELYCGTFTGIRNPLTHEGHTSQYALTRYPDKASLLKYLAFLSILLERADNSLP
jgi:uncharacterized protein (TIGR02391 family)